MTDKQRADLEAGQRGNKFNSDHSVLLNSIDDDDLPGIITGISNQVEAIELAESKQQRDFGKTSKEKNKLKMAMATTVKRYALRAKVKAKLLGLNALENSLKRSKSYIAKVDDILAVTRAKGMKKIMADNKGPGGPLTNITAGDITIMTDAIKAFEKIRNKPTINIKEKKAQGTNRLEPEIKKLKVFINQERNILESYLEGTRNAKLINEFKLKTDSVVLGTRQNMVQVTLLKDEDGKPIMDGKVTSLVNKKTSEGGFTNVYLIKGIQAGMRKFRAEAEGRVTAEFDVKVEKKKTVDVVVRMKLI